MSSTLRVIPNQIFIGLPWKNVKPKYEHAIIKLSKKYPLSFVIIGREPNQDAHDLLTLIKNKLDSSSYAIFDATQGNANVSLEYGYAEAQGINKALYFCTRRSPGGSKDHSIISDLAGKRRNQWTTEKSLIRLLDAFSKQHTYTKRFEKFLQAILRRSSIGEKRRRRSLALKILHQLDDREGGTRREDVMQEILADQNSYSESEAEAMLKGLHKGGLITVSQGRHSTVEIK